MTGIPVPSPTQGPSPRAGIEEAMAGAEAELGAEGVSSQDAPTEVQARIMRIEDLLIARGVAKEEDFVGEVGTDDAGAPVADPALDPAAQGLPPEAAAGAAPPPPV